MIEDRTSDAVGYGGFQAPRFSRRAGAVDREILRASPIYWHSELPPFDAEALGEHVIEATSGRVPSTLTHGDELWHQCYEDLMAQARTRLEQEIIRLKGNCAHVMNESVESRHDGATSESWLHGFFTYMLYQTRSENSPTR